jgi:hypothetical protein
MRTFHNITGGFNAEAKEKQIHGVLHRQGGRIILETAVAREKAV